MKQLGDLKSILTLILVSFLCVLTYQEKIDNSVFIGAIGMVLAFYFSKKKGKDEDGS